MLGYQSCLWIKHTKKTLEKKELVQRRRSLKNCAKIEHQKIEIFNINLNFVIYFQKIVWTICSIIGHS